MRLIRYSMPKQIANDMENKIKKGVYKIGDKLPTEPELVAIYQASRNTVREAVQSLIHAGILEARQGNGTYVIASDRLQVDLFSLMNEVKSKDIVEVRTLLEGYIVQSAVEHCTPEDVQNIHAHLEKRNSAYQKKKENTKEDIAFHIAIAKATHNELLIKMYQYVAQFFAEYISTASKLHVDEQVYIDTLHKNLAFQIENKDTEGAQKSIQEIIHL